MVAAAKAQDRRKSVIRTIIVIALAVYFIGLYAPEIALYWFPAGDYGLIVENRFHSHIEPHSAAADAGIQVDDQIETQYESLHEHMGPLPRAGDTVTLHILHRGKERIVTLVARPVPPASMASEAMYVVFPLIMYVISVGLGAVLVLLRPGLMTWLFYGFMLAGTSVTHGAALSGVFSWLSPPLFVAVTLPRDLLVCAGPFMFALFALLFPNDELTAWGRRALPFALAGLGVSVAVGLVWVIGAIFFYLDSPALDRAQSTLSIGGQAIALTALLFRYWQSHALDRRRITWVIAAFVIPGAIAVARDIGEFWSINRAPPAIFDNLFFFNWVLPTAVAYAIIRYRMFDIEFVLSRTLVYALLILAAVGVFATVDVVFTSRFHGSRVELAVDIAVALGLGFWVRAIQGRAIDLVDRLLFRRRYDARVRLKATLDAVNTANSPRALQEIVTSGAATALGLASAVFFRRVADGGLLREIGFGWPRDALWHVLPDEPLVAVLDKRGPSIDLHALGWSRTGASPPYEPVLAIPMQSGGRVVGVTFYGSRENSVPPSPDEVRGLVTLAGQAASVYLLLDSAHPGIATREPTAFRIAR
jgi:hypothetical protein